MILRAEPTLVLQDSRPGDQQCGGRHPLLAGAVCGRMAVPAPTADVKEDGEALVRAAISQIGSPHLCTGLVPSPCIVELESVMQVSWHCTLDLLQELQAKEGRHENRPRALHRGALSLSYAERSPALHLTVQDSCAHKPSSSLQFINVTSYLAGNLYVASGSCRWFDGFVSIMGKLKHSTLLCFIKTLRG